MIRATFSGFNTALSALQANQKRLDITGQNLSNMNTPGYTRQELKTSSLNYSGPISHYTNGSEIAVGFGVSMDRVAQIRDPFLDAHYRSQMEKSGYSDGMQVSLDSLSKLLDESSIAGIRTAFDDIQSVLTNLQDSSKVNDSVFETELRNKMQHLTNLLNEASQKIDEARVQEYQRLDGEGTNENGAEQTVNSILEQIGQLNRQIKHNQVFNQPSLELMDERNVLLDELASYIPIEVRYKKDEGHKDDKDWPDDLYVDLVFYDENGTKNTLELISGTEGAAGQNYGSVEFSEPDDPNAPLNITAGFQATAASSGRGALSSVEISAVDNATTKGNTLRGGSIQAGLDMLGTDTDTNPVINNPSNIEKANFNVHGYQYYMNHLDNLANGFSSIINTINIMGNFTKANGGADQFLLVNQDDGTTTNIKASNIGINSAWAKGDVTFGKGIETQGNNSNDTALTMLQAMSQRYNGGAIHGLNIDLGNKTFANYMNNVSTILATDSAKNQISLKNNVTVLNGIQDSRDGLSGISLDEEAANMMTYMAAYNAASRLMTTMDEALNTLINNTGLVGR